MHRGSRTTRFASAAALVLLTIGPGAGATSCASDTEIDAGAGDPADMEAAVAAVEEQPSAISPSCVPPPDCLPIRSPFFNIGVCCSETLRCGFDLSILVPILAMLPEIDPSALNFDPQRPCSPRSRGFIDAPGLPEQRVPGAEGPDVLVTPECRSRIIVNTQLAGCCLANDQCGFSTHLAGSAFAVLSGDSMASITRPQCLSAPDLNAQLTAANLAAWAHVPAASGTCDYASLELRTR